MELYQVKRKKNIPLKEIKSNAVVLTGDGPSRVAYYVASHQFVGKHHTIIHSNILLSKQELSKLPKKDGRITKQADNAQLVDTLLYKALPPAYYFKYHIYKRE